MNTNIINYFETKFIQPKLSDIDIDNKENPNLIKLIEALRDKVHTF